MMNNHLTSTTGSIDDQLTRIENRLTGIENRLTYAKNLLAAHAYNNRTIAHWHNLRCDLNPYEPLRPLSRPCRRRSPVMVAIKHTLCTRTRISPLIHHRQIKHIGTTPPDFSDDIAKYECIDFLKLIVFYNDDFGITNTDNLGDRKNKLRAFLMGFDY